MMPQYLRSRCFLFCTRQVVLGMVGKPGLPFGKFVVLLLACKSVASRTTSGIFISYSGFPLIWLHEVWDYCIFLTLA